jgi:hypothetical protein
MSDKQAETTIRHRIEDRRDHMSEIIDAISYKADVPSRMKESISDRTHAARESISHATSSLVHGLTGMTDQSGEAYDAVTERSKQLGSKAEENPLAFALGGMAAGFLLGMIFPSTKVESERIGPMAHEARSMVTETAQEAMERGKHVAEEAYHAAAETAMETGQQESEEMTDSVKKKAQGM